MIRRVGLFNYQLASLVLTGVLIASCGENAAPTPASVVTQPVVSNEIDVAQLTNIPTFFETIGPSRQLKVAIFNKWQSLTAQCMHKVGFTDYKPIPALAESMRERRLESLSLKEIEKYGVTGPPDVEVNRSSIEDEVTKRLDADAAFKNALVGLEDTYSSGCAGQARVLTYGPNGEFSNLTAGLSNLDSEVTMVVYGARRFEELQSDWSKCMGQFGFEFSSRSRMMEFVASRPGNLEEQIRIGVQDFKCRHDVKFGEIVGGLYEESFKTVAEREDQKLRAIKQSLKSFTD